MCSETSAKRSVVRRRAAGHVSCVLAVCVLGSTYFNIVNYFEVSSSLNG
jgi:hypothetical protein